MPKTKTQSATPAAGADEASPSLAEVEAQLEEIQAHLRDTRLIRWAYSRSLPVLEAVAAGQSLEKALLPKESKDAVKRLLGFHNATMVLLDTGRADTMGGDARHTLTAANGIAVSLMMKMALKAGERRSRSGNATKAAAAASHEQRDALIQSLWQQLRRLAESDTDCAREIEKKMEKSWLGALPQRQQIIRIAKR